MMRASFSQCVQQCAYEFRRRLGEREREREFRRRGRARSVGTTGQSDGADRKFIRTILNQPRDSCCVLQGRKFTRRISRPPPLRLPSPLGSKREEKGMEKIERKREKPSCATLPPEMKLSNDISWGGFKCFLIFLFYISQFR